MEVRQNLRGGISTERPKVYILSHKLALFSRSSGSRVEIMQNSFCCILTKRPKGYTLSYNLLVDLEWKLGKIYVVAFQQKGKKCTFRFTNLYIFVDLKWK